MEKDLAAQLYRTMVRIRYFEQTISKWFYRGKIPGFVHLYIGEEAIASGVCAPLKKDDCISSTHRGHGHVLAKGGDPKRMMAEIFGRATGYCRGKGGSMHLADLSIGVMGTNGILAGGVGMATGFGLAFKETGSDRVSVVFIGDAAATQGIVWESLNLAGLWQLPVIYVIENNGFGEYTPTEKLSSTVDFAGRARNWGGVAAQSVDGNDVQAVYQATQVALSRARAGQGPSLIDCKTYRFMGHNEGEEASIGEWSYRSKEELEKKKKHDPIKIFEMTLINERVLSPETLESIHAQAKTEMEEAVTYALDSPLPDPQEALVGVFSSPQ